MSVMKFGRIRDLISNLGWKEDEDTYVLGVESLTALENIEEELLNEDVVNRNVHLSLHLYGTVKKNLIPILQYGRSNKIIAAATRVLVNLSVPVECLSPVEDALLSSKTQNIRRQLLLASLEIKRAFLDDAATFPIVSMLREAMMKSEKHNVPLNEEDCAHLKNCLFLLRNILHSPEESDLFDKAFCSIQDWQSIQNKLIWNLFIQGLDGALLLMLNSKYRVHWTIPLTLIIALVYRNQNITKVHEALELISSASDTSCDEEESDGSKNSSTSLSSEPCKAYKVSSDSGCAFASDTSVSLSDINNFAKKELKCESSCTALDCDSFDIHTKLERVQISDESEPQNNLKNVCNKHSPFSKPFGYRDVDSESSSCSESPHHKKIKGSSCTEKQVFMSEYTGYSSKEDSGVMENMDRSSPDMQSKSSDDDIDDKKSIKNLKAVQKLRSLQLQAKVSESDSSNEDMHNFKIKYRSHPPAGRRGKSPRHNDGCIPSVCLNSAIAISVSKGRMKYPLWEKRNSVTTLVDINSFAPSDKDINNLIKEFTMSFLHSGFSYLVGEIMNLALESSNVIIDKSLLFWMLSYFLHLASSVHLSFDHISNILNTDVIGFLVLECVLACENIEMHSEANMKIKKYLFDQLNLVVTALKEVMVTIDIYAKKSNLQKDKTFFSELCGKLADLQHLRCVPLLLFQNCCWSNAKNFAENTVILNHYILTVMEKGMHGCPEFKRNSVAHHLKQFSANNILNCYGILLESYKYNSNMLNESLFTMLHHIAGDVHASDSLLVPSILKSFSSILKEDVELEPYQEDLIIYILNKFSLQIQKAHLKQRKDEEGESSGSSDHSSSSSSSANTNCLLSEEDDDLFWWYLQFEQDKDPIARISEHIPTSKRDILAKLQLRGILSPEKYQNLETKMKMADKHSEELLSCSDLVQMENFDDEITHLLRNLVQLGWRQHLTWIQDTLLETCYVKLCLNHHIPEPIPYYSIKMMCSVPLVPYTEDQRQILKDEMFLQLLKKIGFNLGNGLMYPRIPTLWTADVLFTIAARLGPMRKDKLKFSYEELLLADPNHDPVTTRMPSNPVLPPLSSCCTLSSWLAAVQKSKEQQKNIAMDVRENGNM